MEDIRERVLQGNLINDVRRLLQGGATEHGRWIRENLRHALRVRREDAGAVSALTGLAPGTVRRFLSGRPSSIDNVLLIAEAAGYTLDKLDRPPERFRALVDEGRDGSEGSAIGASLLAFDESPTAMAIVLLDGKIVKVNRRLRELLGYDEGELVGAASTDFSMDGDGDREARRDELLATDMLNGRVLQLRRKDGTLISVVTSAVVALDDDGQPRYIIARATPVDAGPETG